MRDGHDDLVNRHERRNGGHTPWTPRENPRVLLEIGHAVFLLPAGTYLHEAHAAAALLTRSLPVTEDYETHTLKAAPPCRIRFALIAPAMVPDTSPATTTDSRSGG